MRLSWFSRATAAGLLFTLPGQAQPEATLLTPGFTIRELPVQLTNVNNLRFTPD